MRGKNISTVYHNNINGTCGYCNTMTATFLPEGTTLTVVPPKNAKANNSKAIDYTKTYTGTSNEPKISPQYKRRILNMLIEHFTGKKECNNINELKEVLKNRTEKGVNEFIISPNEKFPYMIMAVNGIYACLSYFRNEDDPGFSSVNANPILDSSGISIFYTNTDNEEIEVANYSIVEVEKAMSAVEEFFYTKQLPKCIEWEKL